MVSTSARVGTGVYRCKTQAVRAGMRLSIAVEHPGNLLHTVTESFSEYYVSGLRKMEKPVVPCAFSGISLRCCLPLRELGLETKFEKYSVNLREVLQENVLVQHLVGLNRIL